MRLNKLYFILAGACFSLSLTSCKKYLDINNDPSNPQIPTLSGLFVPVTASMSRTVALDGRQAGAFIQNWSNINVAENFDLHGGNAGSGAFSQAWRDFYTTQGTAINLILKQAKAEQRWDYVGMATAIRAWGLQNATDYFGEMPYYQAWEPNRVTFAYDRQEVIYEVVDSLCRDAIQNLDRTDGLQDAALRTRGDQVYRGDKSKWRRFAYGILARNWHHQTNKANYNADSVISYVDKSLQTNADNFTVAHSATRNDDTSPLGSARDNFYTRRQSRFIVQLLDGTNFIGNTLPASRDPRLSRMLSVSVDTNTVNTNMPTINGGYRFLIPGTGFTVSTSVTSTGFRQAPSTFYGDSNILNNDVNNFSAKVGKYLFQNNAPFPIMTAFEMQFIKAEAAFKKGDITNAYNAYISGINLHFDYVNAISSTATGVTQISAAQRSAYFSSAAVKSSPINLTVTDIMLQKYIADFGWNLIESWCDLRRYHYFDLDVQTNAQVYRGFAINLYSSLNLGPKPAYRLRPTSFSEYDWNLDALAQIGALNQDYHTYEMWFSQP
jgi:Starch-binding associating with outer membrane